MLLGIGATSSVILLAISLSHLGFAAADSCSDEDVRNYLIDEVEKSFYPVPCSKCTCTDDETEECEMVQCLAPTCAQGELMTFNSSSCCPTCAAVYKDCQLSGLTIQHGESHRNDLCQQCECFNGELSCSTLSCSQVQCTSKLEDGCCKNCSSTMCDDGGRLYPDKSTWQKGNCILCECNNGVKTCFSESCPELNCRHQTITPDGACCPICSNDKCWSNGKLYKTGQRWNTDPCTSCVCINGNTRCLPIECSQFACPMNTEAFPEPGQCCPTCRSAQGMCVEGDNSYYFGQIWNTSRCEYCTCMDGKILCDRVQCSVTECNENEYLQQMEGACCPVCSLKEACVYSDILHSTEKWQPWVVDSCKRCVCNDGQTQCYENACPNGKPIHGTLHDGLKQFSYQELSDGLNYQHDGSADSDDFAVLQGSDSEGLQNVLLQFDVQGSEKLTMVNNKPVEVESAQQRMITRDELLYEAGGDNRDHLIEYSITTAPSAGSTVMIVPQPDGASMQAGWTNLPDGTMLKQIVKFRQSDINDGFIYYQHELDGALTDTFTFQVSYTETGSTLADQVFTINIQPAEVFATPSVSAGSSLGLSAFEGTTVTLTPAHLSFVDSDTDATNITYIITEPLSGNQGMLEYISSPEVPITRFSQQDVDDGLVAYRTPNLEVGVSQPTYSFKFNVTDDAGKTVPEQQFNILLLPVDNKAPSIGSGVRVNVERDGAALLNDALLRVTDVDTPKDELEFAVMALPQHGDIVKLDETFHTFLRVGARYPYKEMLSDSLYYVHDDSPGVDDIFTIELYDTAQSSLVNIPVTIQYSDTDSPTLSPGASMKLKLNEGEKKVITLDELEYVETSIDGLVLYQIASEPQFGKLLYSDQVLVLGDGFTQPDISSRHISYEADEELGNLEIMDTVYLNVSDTAGNMAAMQPFTVSIKASDNHPPIATIHSNLQVEEGRRKQLTKAYISAEDPDSILTNLMVVIDSVPTLGVLKIIASEGVETGVRESQVQMFLLSDLYAGIVYYDQVDHENKEPRSDFFWFHLTDGENISPVSRFNITIMARNDEPPTIISDTIFVMEGDTVAITNSSVYISDIDTEFDGSVADVHTFTVITLPRKGQLQWSNGTVFIAGQSFTMQNILSEDIAYSHSGDEEVSQDSFLISVSDGYYEDSKQVPVDIALMDDETPRVKINDGLRLKVGGVTVIDSTVLHTTDIDSDDDLLIYTITESVHRGDLYMLSDNGTEHAVSVFTPADLRNGALRYRSDRSINRGGFDFFKFDVVDIGENKLMDQVFYIDMIADTTAPTIRVNTPLSVQEDSFGPLTTSNLYITDLQVSPDLLMIYINSAPQYGNLVLEDDRQKARPVNEFTMADIVSTRVFYVHETAEEIDGDSFTFTASDGFNNVTETFRVRVVPVDDSIPVVTMSKLMVNEGEDKILTEFDVKVTDNDTADDMLLISLLVAPSHGALVLTKDGEEIDDSCLLFTMADIYEGRVSYRHDNTESTADSFTFIVMDQANDGFFLNTGGEMVRTTSPVTMEVSIQLVDDGMPRVDVNRGISSLQTDNDGQVSAKIGKSQLRISDPDTNAESITIKVTQIPTNGILIRLPDTPVSQFTQEDINNELIVYKLSDDVTGSDDNFKFSVMDSRPNVVDDLTFHIVWSTVQFVSSNISANEQQGVIEVSVVRSGSLYSYASVGCELTGEDDEHPSGDMTVLTTQIQFEKGDNSAMCRLSVVNDTVYEGRERFTLRLISPTKTLVGTRMEASISLADFEDEPVIEFKMTELKFNESVGLAHVPVVRAGDTSTSTTVLCSTISRTAVGSDSRQLQSGTDYISRDDFTVTFSKGETIANCDIRIIDDTLYEVDEKFEVMLSSPSHPAKLGKITTATVLIAGPNDASAIEMGAATVGVYEDEETVTVEIIRVGLDLSKPATVWCTTTMASGDGYKLATPGVDYVAVSRKISFSPGQSHAACEVTILDDTEEPIMEGVETFAVTINAADSRSVIGQVSTTLVTIDDLDLDAPELSFVTAKYTVNENSGTLSMPIIRTGDVSCSVSIICYTRQQSATVMDDYNELPLTNASRVELLSGERNGSCELEIIDDTSYETSEFLLVRLAEAAGCEAMSGDLDVAVVTIQDPEDEPKISLGASSYSIREPISDGVYTAVRVHVNRMGDLSEPVSVRLSTRDKSAISGIDYSATSVLVDFFPDQRTKWVEIKILYNPDVEWHESFMVVLEEFSGVSAGVNTSAVINILDTDVTGGLVLPAVPMVISLNDYNSGNVKLVTEVSPGYPLICLSPCDPLYPQYRATEHICQSSRINSSAMAYGWEVSYPVQTGSKVSSYLTVSQDTSFSRVDSMLLETFYFRAGFNVRCIATPLHPNGQTGVPIKSTSVGVHSKGVCSNPVISNAHGSMGAQSFIAKLDYIEPDEDDPRANTIHMTVEVPHQDGMLPIISTMPIYNINYLLTQSTFAKQHVCSNLPNTSHSSEDISAFLGNALNNDVLNGELRVPQAVRLYKHLNHVTCRWKFEAWFELSQIMNYCGGRVTHNFDVESASKSFVTVHQPLYVSYIYAKAPTGWASLSHQTSLEFSFYYDTVKFESGGQISQEPKATADIMRVGIGQDGRMSIHLRTRSHFRGILVAEHYTASTNQVGQLIPPKAVASKFTLRHQWTQPTFDGPVQMWRATSRYSLQDYSGTYTLRLLACVATAAQSYDADADQQKCAVMQVIEFPLNIAFQQSNRPVPLVYSLATQFQLTNNKRLFLMDPQTADIDDTSQGFHGVFAEGERLFGRVFWDPSQDLDSAFRLQLDKVFICTGLNGYIPTYDPTGKIYNEGPQYGCLETSDKLKHRFLLLDRGAEDVTTKEFNGLPFKANFADSMSGLADMELLPSTDGFVLSVDPLFSTTSGQQWHVQILYRIGTPDSLLYSRRRRSLGNNDYKVGTNLIMLNLKQVEDDIKSSAEETNQVVVEDNSKVIIETKYVTSTTVIVVLVAVVLLVVVAGIVIVLYVRRAAAGTTHMNYTLPKRQKSDEADTSSSAELPPPSYDQVKNISLSQKMIGTAV